MYAIVVSYVPHTNTKPARFKVTMGEKKCFFNHDGLCDKPINGLSYYKAALKLFCEQNNLIGFEDMKYGALPNGDYAFCFDDSTLEHS